MNPQKPEKKLDLPPRGDLNVDPISGQSGAHPIEAGVGAAAAGAAAGMAAGSMAGPAGAVLGATVGAVVGGLAGKEVGELIDPTLEDTWLREHFSTRPYVRDGDTYESYEPAYRHGARCESQYGYTTFEVAEREIRRDWMEDKNRGDQGWDDVKYAVRDSYNRCRELRKQRTKADQSPG